VLAVVVVSAATGAPRPGFAATRLGVTLALATYVVVFIGELRPSAPRRRLARRCATSALLGAAGIALAALQPRGAVELAPSIAVWLAATRLPIRIAVPLAAAITLGLDVAIALRSAHWGQSVAASTLLCALLFVVAEFMRRTNESAEQAERLLAALEEARDAQAHAAALAERGRIARDLHDVLAHSLSALTLQLEGARLLAKRDGAKAELADTIARAARQARNGLTEAKQAVGALRGEALPTAADLPALVDGFRNAGLDATLEVVGAARDLSTVTSRTLYRVAQEALTNALRYAPGAHASVTLRYDDGRVSLAVADTGPNPQAEVVPLAGVGGGHGLEGIRERIESLGGAMRFGPAGNGFRVEVEAPA
jgi:signal transduction histidine kinase